MKQVEVNQEVNQVKSLVETLNVAVRGIIRDDKTFKDLVDRIPAYIRERVSRNPTCQFGFSDFTPISPEDSTYVPNPDLIVGRFQVGLAVSQKLALDGGGTDSRFEWIPGPHWRFYYQPVRLYTDMLADKDPEEVRLLLAYALRQGFDALLDLVIRGERGRVVVLP